MKRSLVLWVIVMLIAVIAMPDTALCLRRENLYEILSDASEVNIYIAPIKDSTGDEHAPEVLELARKEIEDAFKMRMTINFKVVEEAQKADIIVEIDVVESVWMDTDPIDTPSLYGAVADAAIDMDYARVRADVTILKGPRKKIFKRFSKRRKVIAEKDIMATHDQFNMSREESVPIIARDLANVIMMEFFSKKSKTAMGGGRHVNPIR